MGKAGTFKFNCPSCNASIRAPAASVGKMIQCPGCKARFAVPKDASPSHTIFVPTAAVLPDAPSDLPPAPPRPKPGEPALTFHCGACGHAGQTGIDNRGLVFTCPDCSAAVQMPTMPTLDPEPAAFAASVLPPLAPAPRQDLPPRQTAALSTCPDCGSEVSRRAQKCPRCGCPFDVRQRERESGREALSGRDRTWKLQTLLGALTAVAGTVISCIGCGLMGATAPQNTRGDPAAWTLVATFSGLALLGGGLVWFVIARICDWWENG